MKAQRESNGIALHKFMYNFSHPNTIFYQFYSRLHVSALIVLRKKESAPFTLKYIKINKTVLMCMKYGGPSICLCIYKCVI